MRSEYLLFKRSTGAHKGKIYYVKFWDFNLKKYTPYSVKSLQSQLGDKARHLSPTSKAGANTIVKLWLKEGRPINRSKDTFVSYLSSFWEKDSAYTKAKELRGQKLSELYRSNNHGAILKHVIPYLEKTKQDKISLSQVTSALLENLLMYLSDNTSLSNRRINSIYQAVTVPLSEAKRLGKIAINPANSVRKLAEKKPERKILTPDEVRKFFSVPPDDLRLYGINLLAATTGMRLGECRGLQTKDFHNDWIDIKWNWQDEEGLKSPKWGSARAVPVPSRTAEVLQEVININPWGNNFVFYGHDRSRPIGKRSIENHFRRTLEIIGIDNNTRKERNLSFHAWRHFYNTMLRGRIPDHALRKLTGHKSEKMSDRYTEITDDQIKDVGKLAEELF